jgi:hypothetical protein
MAKKKQLLALAINVPNTHRWPAPSAPGFFNGSQIGGLVMTMERYIRAIAGSFVLLSLLLGYLYSPYWHLFTAFVGANLLQSAFTKWCLMEDILRKFGLPVTP